MSTISEYTALGIKICEALELPADRIQSLNIHISAENPRPRINVNMIDLDGALNEVDWAKIVNSKVELTIHKLGRE